MVGQSMQPGEIDAQAAQRQLDRILASSGFARNERLSRFLRFVVESYLEGNHNDLKESVIAVEVFGRRADYDPKLDSIVRTEAGRLRARLADYYAADGVHDIIVIDIPKGAYVPALRLRTPEEQGSKSRFIQRRLLIVSSALLAILATIAGWLWFERKTQPVTIAVLPLENLGHDPANDYFVDGLTDEIINNLSVIDGLVVRSRTSSFALKEKTYNIREAGTQLNADYILEGSVLRANEKLRVNAELVRVRDDFPLWSGKFDREASDVFAIQDEISRGIVNNLRLQLGGGQRRYNTNLEAYDLYLDARQFLNRGGLGVKARDGLALFQKVLEKDPSFAPAYAGLAEVYGLISSNSAGYSEDSEFSEGNAKITEYVDKALQLDPLLAEAWVYRGLILARNYQWTESEKAFRRALELNPNLPDAHVNYGGALLFHIGRREEGIRQLRTAVELDPLSEVPRLRLAYLLVSDGRADETLKVIDRLKRVELTDQMRGRVLLLQNRPSEAIPYFHGPGNRGFLGVALASAGQRAEAEALRKSDGIPNHRALICAGLGDKDCVFEALNQMADAKDPRIHLYIVYPELALIREDTRLQALKRKIGL